MVGNFQQRKKDVLSKIDKSSIGKWDEKILGLCEKINSLENYYTTSSCSGRIVLIKCSDKKGPDLFEFVSHDFIDFTKLKGSLDKIEYEGAVKFKSEPCIIHIACSDLESAEELLNKGREAGWKRSGILSLGKNIIVELNSTEKLEFPIMKNGKVLVDDDFLKLIVHGANNNLKKSWEKIEKLEESI